MIVLFQNAREAIRADAIARDAGLECRVRPVPEEYSAECGMCIYLSDKRIDAFRKLMSQNGIDAVYHEEK